MKQQREGFLHQYADLRCTEIISKVFKYEILCLTGNLQSHFTDIGFPKSNVLSVFAPQILYLLQFSCREDDTDATHAETEDSKT